MMNRRHFFKLGFAGIGTMISTRNIWGLKYFPMPSDKKCAILYSTWCGSTRDAAVWISEGMGGIAEVFDVREEPDLHGFEHIIIGGAIRGSVTSQELQAYITQNKQWLKERVRGLFAVCGNMRQPTGSQQIKMFIENHLAKLCGVKNVPSRVFNGRVTKALMDPQTRKMMEKFEDYDDLKRSECMTFGAEILNSI